MRDVGTIPAEQPKEKATEAKVSMRAKEDLAAKECSKEREQ